MQESRTEHRSNRVAGSAAFSQNAVRMGWFCRLNDATQVLVGAIETGDAGAIQRALLAFEHGCPAPASATERVVLRGTVVEMFLLLETAVSDWTTSVERASARKQLHEVAQPSMLHALLAPVLGLTAAAQRMRTLPLHERVREWIDQHPDDPRSIRDMAALLGAHPRTLNRHFARHLGKTVQEYRWDRRAERAEQLIATSALKIEDVASAVGAGKATVYRLLHRKTRSRRH